MSIQTLKDRLETSDGERVVPPALALGPGDSAGRRPRSVHGR